MANQVTTLKMGQKFKQTPAGEIPVDWECHQLGEVAGILGGGTPDRTNSRYWGGNIHWATPTDVTSVQGTTISSTKEMISDSGLTNSAATLMPPGSILMTSRATLGHVVINTVPMATNQGFANFLCRENIHNWFLRYLLCYKRNELERLGAGSTFLEIPKTALRKLAVQVPPLREQIKIAEILSSVDNAIEETDAVIKKQRTLKDGLAQELFTRGTGEHNKLKTTAIGRLPEDWDLHPCKDICDMVTVGIVIQPARLYTDTGVPCLRSLNIHEDSISVNNLVFISAEANEAHAKSKLRAGDVVAVRTGYPGTACVIPEKFEGANCVDLIILRPGRLIVGHFLSRFINSPEGRKQIERAQGGLAQQHFNVGEAAKMLIPVPPLHEQEKIAGILRSIEGYVEREEDHCRSLMDLKSALMHTLLTGKIRTN